MIQVMEECEGAKKIEDINRDETNRSGLSGIDSLVCLVEEEKDRSERYNHYFSLLTVWSPNIGAMKMLRRISPVMRVADKVGVVDQDDRFYSSSKAIDDKLLSLHDDSEEIKVVVLLPETDRLGAERVIQRIRVALGANTDAEIGMAVYPDDATSVAGLMAGANL